MKNQIAKSRVIDKSGKMEDIFVGYVCRIRM